ncbi:1-deoxy-D-xylulose-5-phosphate reductoisomerase, partial [Mannheimia haemolytica]
QIRFTDIVNVNRTVVENIAPIQVSEIADVLYIDKLARELAKQAVLQL